MMVPKAFQDPQGFYFNIIQVSPFIRLYGLKKKSNICSRLKYGKLTTSYLIAQAKVSSEDYYNEKNFHHFLLIFSQERHFVVLE